MVILIMNNTPNSTDILLEKLIKGQDNLNEKVGDLVTIEARRGEREIAQNIKNEAFQEFIKENDHALYRLRRWQLIMDSSITKLVGAGLVGFSVWLGLDWFK